MDSIDEKQGPALQPQEPVQQNSENGSQAEDNDQPTKNNSGLKLAFIFWSYILLFIGFMVVCIYFSMDADKRLESMASSDAFYYGNQVAYTWKKGFVNDVKVVAASANCPNNYEIAFTYSWPGSGYGCFCSADNNVTFVVQGYCSAQLIQQQCKNLKAQNATEANIWKNSSKFCVKRSVISFYNEPLPYTNTKICGKSNSLVIVPVTEPCPLVNISYTPFVLQNNMITITSTVLPNLYGSFDSTSSASFYSYPIINFRVDESQYCLIDTDYGISPDHSDFILLNNYRGCRDSGNYTTFDTIDEATFYSVNPTFQALTTIQGFPTPGNWEYKLGFLSMPSWTYKCRFNYQKNYNIPNATDIVNLSFRDFQKSLYIPIYVCFGILLAELLILVLRRIFKSDVYPVGFKKVALPRQFVSGILRIIVELFCKTLLFAIFIYLGYKSYSNWNWIVTALNLNCPDSNPQLINKVLMPYQQLYLGLYRTYTALIAICVVMLIIDGIYNVYVYQNELRFYMETASGKKLIDQDVLDKELADLEKKDDPIPLDKIDEEMKKTMAQGFVVPNENELVLARKKKKKKRIGGKNLFSKDEPSAAIINDFNPYDLDVEPMDSLQQINDGQQSIELGIQRQGARKKPRRR